VVSVVTNARDLLVWIAILGNILMHTVLVVRSDSTNDVAVEAFAYSYSE
jgi:hypothetical protein